MTHPEITRILGTNIRSRRHDLDYTLANVASLTGVSISHLSEIERGLKYPGADTLTVISDALQSPVEDLFAHSRATSSRTPPFRTTGTSAEDATIPAHLTRRLNETMVSCRNRLPHVEEAATKFLSDMGRYDGQDPTSAVELENKLLHILQRTCGVTVNMSALSENEDLKGLRSVSVPGSDPLLLINQELLPSQRAFILAKEIGTFRLRTLRRTAASPWLTTPTWRDVQDNHATSYFAGCVLLPEQDFVRTMRTFLERQTWSPSRLLQCMNRFSATPEMFFYRLGQVAATHLGLEQHLFMRLSFRRHVTVSRLFNMTRLPLPHLLPLTEHVCRRWAGLRMLHRRAEERADGLRTGAEPHAPSARAQRVELAGGGGPLLVLAMSRPLQLGETGDSAVMMGIPLDRPAHERIGFATDRRLHPVHAGTTCQRCPLTDCEDRQADPALVTARERLKSRSRALSNLIRRINR
ncbi:MAG: hypothetical protein COV99_07830 [Bacteroidetes bacterium CG12_big_fil_rev_8_21_14_0_65_60_17]|nr:MAG: hypothetical protein COV99_07830 [Bacteroidetes bacterium CG12_big_fil_rev_8_21_14_0_65_60_17]